MSKGIHLPSRDREGAVMLPNFAGIPESEVSTATGGAGMNGCVTSAPAIRRLSAWHSWKLVGQASALPKGDPGFQSACRRFHVVRREAGWSPPQTKVCPTASGSLGQSEQDCGLAMESQIRMKSAPTVAPFANAWRRHSCLLGRDSSRPSSRHSYSGQTRRRQECRRLQARVPAPHQVIEGAYVR
jgi:hypothetical protein